MFGRKKKKEAQVKTGAPEKQSQLAVVKDAYRLVKKIHHLLYFGAF